MDLVIKDSEIKEIRIEDVVKSRDNGLVVNNLTKPKPIVKHTELQKELAAIEAINTSTREAATIHGIKPDTLNEYVNGNNVNTDTKAAIAAAKYGITELATAKLMQTLGLLNPAEIEKQTDLARVASSLGTIVRDSSGKRDGNQQVHLHMYMPSQKKVKDYNIIDV